MAARSTPQTVPRPRNGPLARVLARWHRYAGLTAAALVLLLAVTGVMLNHTDALELDARHVSSPALLDWYGIEAPDTVRAYGAGGHWITQVGERLYLDAEPLPGGQGRLAGAVASDGILVVAAGRELLLLAGGGELIERLPVAGPVQAIGLTRGGRVAIRTPDGSQVAGADLLVWSSESAPAARWAAPEQPPAALREELAAAYRGSSITWERVVLDLHSGRLLGAWGPWLMDLAALLMVLLAGSGIYIWIKRRS